jgi:hypothetical protein
MPVFFNVVHDYNLPDVAIHLLEAGNQKFSNKWTTLIIVAIALLKTEQGSQTLKEAVAAR